MFASTAIAVLTSVMLAQGQPSAVSKSDARGALVAAAAYMLQADSLPVHGQPSIRRLRAGRSGAVGVVVQAGRRQAGVDSSTATTESKAVAAQLTQMGHAAAEVDPFLVRRACPQATGNSGRRGRRCIFDQSVSTMLVLVYPQMRNGRLQVDVSAFTDVPHGDGLTQSANASLHLASVNGRWQVVDARTLVGR